MKIYIITASKVFGGIEEVLAAIDENEANRLFVEVGNKHAFVETPFETPDEVAEWFSRNNERVDVMVQFHISHIAENAQEKLQSKGESHA